MPAPAASAAQSAATAPWDLFCRVIDNHGDAGVCWRLAAQLAQRGQTVRLWMDDPSPLEFMAPRGTPGVSVLPASACTMVFVALVNWVLSGTPVATVPLGFIAWSVIGIEKKSIIV